MGKAKVTIKMRPKDVGKLLRRDDVKGMIDRSGGRIEDAAGEGFEYRGYQGRDRYRGVVRSTNAKGRRREAEERALTKALDAGK